MTDRSITMTSREVQALLAGMKTQTRRVLNLKGPGSLAGLPVDTINILKGKLHCTVGDFGFVQPLPYAIGDRLWCREDYGSDGKGGPLRYPATDDMQGCDRILPAIVMPLSASRLTLIVTDVWVQRVQEISDDDAMAELGLNTDYATDMFDIEWDRCHTRPEHQWKANPWVCALTFDVVKANIDEVTA